MSALAHLRALAGGILPAEDGILGNARFAWGRSDTVGDEAILASFSAHPFELQSDLLEVTTPQGAALIGRSGAMVADVYDGRIGRLWRIGGEPTQAAEPAIDVAFDPDMHQQRGDVSFRLEDHPGLDSAAVDGLLAASRELIERVRGEGKLRARGFLVRAFGDATASAALLSIYALGNETTRTAGFSFAVIGAGSGSEAVHIVREQHQSRPWMPRL
jgi:hypothetical protein